MDKVYITNGAKKERKKYVLKLYVHRKLYLEHTCISNVEHHANKYKINQVKADAISKYGIPEHQQILHRKLTAEQETHPSAESRNNTECI